MRVLVTGGAGFIGSHVVDLLLEQGHDVRVFDKLVEQVHRGKGAQFVPAEAEFIQAGMTDRPALLRALQGVDQVVHLAAEVGVGQSMYQVSRYVDANTGGTGVLLDILANDKHRVTKIVVASSMSVYGEGLYDCPVHGARAPRLRTEEQLRERRWELSCPDCGQELTPLPTPESKPLFPTSVYAVTKKDQELLCLSVGAAYGIGVTALRYFNTYGPRQALSNPYTGVAAIFSCRLLNQHAPLVNEDGSQLRDFIHVSDVARATVAALTAPRCDGQAINVGVGDPISIRQVAVLLARQLSLDIQPEVTSEYRAGDIRHCWADPTLAKELLDFEPRYRFRESGVKDLVEWVRQQTAEDQLEAAVHELHRRGLSG